MTRKTGWAAVAVIAMSTCAEVRVDESPDRVEVPLAVPFKRIGTLIPRGAPDPQDEQWMIGCEVLDRDFAKFSAYKDFLPQLGIRSIRLQGGWAKCEKEKGKFDFAWLDECIDFARTNGLNPVLETGYGNPADTDAVGGHHTPENIAAFNVRTAKMILKNIADARIAGLCLLRRPIPISTSGATKHSARTSDFSGASFTMATRRRRKRRIRTWRS